MVQTREERLQKKRAYYYANKERILELSKIARSKNKGIRERKVRDPEKRRAYARKWYRKNPDKIKKYSKNYYNKIKIASRKRKEYIQSLCPEELLALVREQK